jgi:hypothetical protein
MVRPAQPPEAKEVLVVLQGLLGNKAIILTMVDMVMAVHTVVVALEQTMVHGLGTVVLALFESCGDQDVHSRLMRLNKDIIK